MQLNLFDYRDPDPEPTPEPARSNLIPFRPSLSVELFGPGSRVSAARDDLQRRVNRLVDRVGCRANLPANPSSVGSIVWRMAWSRMTSAPPPVPGSPVWLAAKSRRLI
ncbi:hypothetical protein [uncultured Mediterranean phage uvDeep-CGR2-KM20-C133]|nr:hypothetical protein [uncultured Mediterranean phage uvDeep-CGR2-KM20-C133]